MGGAFLPVLRFWLMWFAVTLAAADSLSAATMEPLPFTGYLQYEGQSSIIPMRMTLISRYERLPEDNSVVSSSSAIVTFFLGELDGPESIPMYYDRADYNRNTKLFRLETSFAFHPRITFSWDFEAEEVRGDVLSTSQQNGRFVKGHFVVKRGWNLPTELPFQGSRMQAVAGLYSGHCKADGSSSNVALRNLQIFPSRFGGSIQRPNDTTMTAITYVGNIQCIRSSDVSSQHVCGSHEGVVNIANNTLSIGSNNHGIFQCSRDAATGNLICNGERFRQCRLTREDLPIRTNSGSASPVWPKPSIVTPPIERSPEPPMDRLEFERRCAAWEGGYNAILTHATSGRQQIISLNLVHYVSDDPRGRRCNVSGGVNLSIGRDVLGDERLLYQIPSSDLDVSKTNVAIRTQGDSDRLVLQLNKIEDGVIHGYLYSTSWGFVGEFQAVNGADVSVLASTMTNPVRGLVANRWVDEFDRSSGVFISIAQRSSDRGVNSPYAQLLIQGWMEQQLPSPDGPINFRENIAGISYDLFANHFTIRSEGVFMTGAFWGDEIRSLIAVRRNGALAKEPGRIHKLNKSQ